MCDYCERPLWPWRWIVTRDIPLKTTQCECVTPKEPIVPVSDDYLYLFKYEPERGPCAT